MKTSNIDRFFEKSIMFTKAFAHTPTTLASHASILLGGTPLYHGVHENGNFFVQDEFLTLAEHLKSYGYATGAFVGAYPLDSRYGLNQGFDVYDDDYGSNKLGERSYVERKAEVVVSRALGWLEAQKNPWFLWVHCFDPHDPYDPPEPFKSQYMNRLYDGEVAYVDFELGKLFSYLQGTESAENTIIILTGDHGESLGEHGEMTHGYFAYNSTLAVPLIISIPGEKHAEINHYVSHQDIFPTVCDALKIKVPDFIQGISLLPAIKGKKLPKRKIYFESLYPYYSRGWAPLRGLISGEEKFIDSPIPELYDLKKDFNESKNLAGGRNIEGKRKELNKFITNHSNPIHVKSSQRVIDRESLEKLRSLGYVSSFQEPQEKSFGPSDDIKMLLPYHNKTTAAIERYKKGQVQQAIQELQDILSERKDIDVAYSHLAIIYKEQRRIQEALGVLRDGLKFLPSSYEIFSTYMNYLIDAGHYNEAIEIFYQKKLRQMEHDPEIWNYLGVAYSQIGNFTDAIKAYEMAISLDRDYPVVYCNIGAAALSLYFKTKELKYKETAFQNFEKAITLDPEYASAYNGLGAVYQLDGNIDKAISCWAHAVNLKPDFGNAIYNLGLAYLKRGDKALALEWFEKYKDKFYSRLSSSEQKKLKELIESCR